MACKQEHGVPIGVTRTYVKQVELGRFPDVSRHFQVTRCNQCDDPPCVDICPTSAMFQRPDGIVDFDRSTCIGCQACIAACPYDAIYMDPVSGSAEKCNFCSSRIDIGLQPACVAVCPTQAIFVGDLNDPGCELTSLLADQDTQVRKPEKNTNPKLFYVNGHECTMTPTAATFSGVFQQSQPQSARVDPGGEQVADWAGSLARPSSESSLGVIGPPEQGTPERAAMPGDTAAAAILAYDNRHATPWNWKVSAYTWTKSVSAGAILMSSILGIMGRPLSWGTEVGVVAAAGLFLLMTTVLMVMDLGHPKRFLYTLLRPQWRSWVARGAYVIAAFGGYLGVYILALIFESEGLIQSLRWVGAVLAAAAGAYTAFLFRQAKGRDLWQDPGLSLHFLVQVGLAGAAVLMFSASVTDESTTLAETTRWALVTLLVLHLAMALGQLVVHNSTSDGRAAVRNMIWTRFRLLFWAGIIGGIVLPLILVLAGWTPGPAAATGAALALIGLALYEHAYVQAGQSVPLS